MIRLQGVTRAYGVHEVLKGVDLGIPPRSRLGLVGPNGAGKSTMPEAGRRPRGARPRDGGGDPRHDRRLSPPGRGPAGRGDRPGGAARAVRRHRRHGAPTRSPAPRDGDRLESLTRRAGDLQHRFEVAGGFDLEARARAILGGLGFGPDDHARPLRVFSGGYRMRAALGALLLRQPEYLLLDEPTNHLDLEAVGWLEQFLSDIFRHRRRQHLEGDLPAKTRVEGPVDLAHPACADLLFHAAVGSLQGGDDEGQGYTTDGPDVREIPKQHRDLSASSLAMVLADTCMPRGGARTAPAARGSLAGHPSDRSVGT